MPQRKRKVEYQGSMVEATPMPHQTGGEHWNEYLLDDGSVLRLKPVVTDILRVDGEYDADGNPAYIVRTAQILSVIAPDELRRDG